MSSRYWISGVQLSLFTYLKEKQAMELVNKIVDEQFIGNYPTETQQKDFRERMKRRNK